MKPFSQYSSGSYLSQLLLDRGRGYDMRSFMLKSPSSKDRRGLRSPLPSQALKLQLRHVAKNYRLDLIMLVDASGRVWADSGLSPLHTVMREMLSNLNFQPDSQGYFRSDLQGIPLLVKQIILGNTILFLAAAGEPNRSIPGLAHASSGVERILSVLLPKTTGKSA